MARTDEVDERDLMEYARELGQNLLRARMDLGFSQERVAQIAGISGYTYQKYEKGESSPGRPTNLTLRVLLALSQALEVHLCELLPHDVPDLTQGR